MSEEVSKFKRLLDRLQQSYRLVILNHETFEEVGSYRLSLLNVYVVISTLMVLVAALVISLIVFTPLKRFIPGYGSGNANPQLIQLNRELDSITQVLEAHQVYTEHFRKMLVGEVETAEDMPKEAYEPGDSNLQIDRIEEDEALRQEVALEEIRQETQSKDPAMIESREAPLEQLYFTPPITGEVSAVFKPQIKHFGIDILAPKNTPIKSAMDGWVIISDWTLETGYTIGIQHANNIVTFYKHNSALLKDMGSFVKAGEAVAIIGNTGTLSDGPHLHFEIWQKGMPVDPAQYIHFN